MKVKYKLSKSHHYRYIITVNNINFLINIIGGKLYLYGNDTSDENLLLSKIESALATIRGFFAHKENMDKLLKLNNINSENVIHSFSTPTEHNPVFDMYMENLERMRRSNGV